MKKRLNISFLVIALSLAVTTGILGLSAYLTNTDSVYSTFRTMTGEEFGFYLSGDEYDSKILSPGEKFDYNIAANVSKSNPLYVFVKVDISSDLTIKGFDKNAVWWPVMSDAEINADENNLKYKDVYYFGGKDSILTLGTENGSSARVLSSITVPESATVGDSFHVDVTGYAILADDHISSEATPKQIYDMIGEKKDTSSSSTQNGGE